MLDRLVDDIYEAAVIVERWPKVLADLTRLGEAAGASFVSAGDGPMRWMGTPEIEALIQDFVKQPHPNPRIPIGLARREGGFLTDLDILSRERIDADPFYTEFMRPRGLGWCIGTSIFAPGADPIIFAVERHYDSGPPPRAMLDTFDKLRPHLARATLLSVRLGLERALAQTQALAMLGYPAAVLNVRGQAIAMNELMQALTPALVEDRRERLVCTDPQADRLLVQAIAARQTAGASVRSFPVRSDAAPLGAVLHLLPMRGAAPDIFVSAATLALLTPVAPEAGPDTKLLEALFDLTPAEARVARNVGEAKTLDALAKTLGLSRETVRAQLKAVFGKTGTRRQVELVRLLARIPQPR